MSIALLFALIAQAATLMERYVTQLWVTLCMWQYVCDTMYVTVCMWQYVCDSMCVTLCMWHYVCDSMCVTVCAWQYICDSMYAMCLWGGGGGIEGWTQSPVAELNHLLLNSIICRWTQSSAAELNHLSLNSIICRWTQSSVAELNHLLLNSIICCWTQSSVAELNHLLLNSIICCWTQSSVAKLNHLSLNSIICCWTQSSVAELNHLSLNSIIYCWTQSSVAELNHLLLNSIICCWTALFISGIKFLTSLEKINLTIICFYKLIFLIFCCFPRLFSRGASLRFLPTISVHGYFYCAAIVSILFHFSILLIRAHSRQTDNTIDNLNGLSHIGGVQAYGLLGWPVWVASLFLLPLGGIVSSTIVNKFDGTAHRRYLQYLRLEFDTRLGMHSPR